MDGMDGLAGVEILFLSGGFVFIGLEIGFVMPTLRALIPWCGDNSVSFLDVLFFSL